MRPSSRTAALPIALALLALSLLFAACTDEAEPLPEPSPTPGDAGAWERVQESGRIVFATASGYEPFVYYDEELRLAGFDVDFARAIGEHMGVEVEFQDMAFESLADALLLEQAEAAIGAISVTPERTARFDFSNIYWIGTDAILAAAGSDLGPFESYEELAPYRLGVQAASVYHRALEEQLVETGLMPSEQLADYALLDHALTDLRDGRIDLVVLDRQPALRARGAEIVAEGLSQESYAIAMAPGSLALRDAIDDAIAALQQDGTTLALAREHGLMNGEAPSELPTASPGGQPTAPPPEEGACLLGSALVEHLSYDDRDMTTPPTLGPGQGFRKGWRVRNTGICPWTPGFTVAYGGGNEPAAGMGGEVLRLDTTVAPGETVDLYVDLVAPLEQGTYQAYWEMNDVAGQPFGARLPVVVRVEPLPTLTPAPTQTPQAAISFSVDRQVIDEGESVTFDWSASGARQVYFYEEGQDWRNYPVANPGQRQVWPAHSTHYHLRVVFAGDVATVRQIPIEVVENETAPDIEHFALKPDREVQLGACVTLEWEVSGAVESIRITVDDRSLWENAPSVSRMQHCPQATGSTRYALDATGPGGTSSRSAWIEVLPGSAPPPAASPTPGSPPPQITSFVVVPNAIEAGGCVSIRWSVYGTADRIQIERDGILVQDYAARTGSSTECLSTPGTVTYRIRAMANDGRADSREAPVFVAETGSGSLPSGVPRIASFSLDPSEIAQGRCVNLTWRVETPNLLGLQIRRDGSVVYDQPTPSGRYTDCPPGGSSTINYNLEARGEGGSSTATRYLTVR